MVYDVASRTALIRPAGLKPDNYTLTVKGAVTSVQGLRMGTDYVTHFQTLDDLSAAVDVEFKGTRYNRALGTVSYEVLLTNKVKQLLWT